MAIAYQCTFWTRSILGTRQISAFFARWRKPLNLFYKEEIGYHAFCYCKQALALKIKGSKIALLYEIGILSKTIKPWHYNYVIAPVCISDIDRLQGDSNPCVVKQGARNLHSVGKAIRLAPHFVFIFCMGYSSTMVAFVFIAQARIYETISACHRVL